jgi:ABC-type branched-subunit amino acid transport system substrate-binding protein
MLNMRKYDRAVPAAIVLAVLGIGLPILSARAADHVQVDMNLPLSGPIAVVTIPYRDGLLMGLKDGAKEHNLSPDIFVTDVQDNASEAKQAVTIMQKQLLEPFDVYISGVSGQTRAVAPEIDKTKAAHFLYAFDVNFTGGAQNRIRVLPNFGLQEPLYVGYAKSRNAKRIAALHLNYASQQEFYSELVPLLQKNGAEVMREAYDIGTRDYSTLALKVAAFKPDLIIVEGFSFTMAPLISALRTLDLVHDGNLIAGMDFIDLLHNKTPVDQLKGIAFAAPLVELPDGEKAAGDWIAKFKSSYKEDPSWPGAYGYDTGRIIAAAYAKAHRVNPETIRSVMPFDGIVGRINLDKTNDIDATMAIGFVQADGVVKEIK